MLAATWVLAGSTTMIALLGVLAAVLGLAAPERLGTIFVQVRESYNRAIRARDLAYLVTDVGNVIAYGRQGKDDFPVWTATGLTGEEFMVDGISMSFSPDSRVSPGHQGMPSKVRLRLIPNPAAENETPAQ